MPNGPGPRQPEPIHVLPDDMADLPIDGKVLHMSRMIESYFHRLFTHTYGIEFTLKDDVVGLCPRMRTVEEYQAQLKNQDTVSQAAWVRERRRFEGRVLAGLVIAIAVEAVGLAIVSLALLNGG